MATLHAALLCLVIPSAGETVLYDFSADWCVPCRMMEPTVASLKAKGYPVRQVNIDREPDLKRKFGVDKVPTFVLVKDGRVVARAMGMARLAQLEGMLNQAGVHPPGKGVERALAQSPDSRPQAIPDTRQAMPATPAGGGWQQYATPRDRAGFAGVDHASPADLSSIRQQALAASVRLEIGDRGGASFGSGTIIDVDGQDALVLTCGHVFREAGKNPAIKVTLYDQAAPETIEGRLVGYDLDRDIGLIAIRPRRNVAFVPVAATGYRVGQGQAAITVGCNHGAAPTVEATRVKSLNKYQGPPNLQTEGMPVQGRSGGGLFSADGYVVGVCNAADPADREGLFAAIESVHKQLDDAQLSRIYRDRPAAINTQLAATAPPPMPSKDAAAIDDRTAAGSNWKPGETDETAPRALPAALGTNLAASADLPSNHANETLSPAENAALHQIESGLGQSEMILIISNPNGRSEIIVLDQASPAFRKRAEAMAAAYREQPQPHYTSHKVQRDESADRFDASAPSPYLRAGNTNTAKSVWEPQWR
jgi:thiol-disulfide isomerase/thioredoxin